jgi:hypothetical protein
MKPILIFFKSQKSWFSEIYIGVRNPVSKQEKNPVLGTYFFSRQPPRKISAAIQKITSKGAD